MHNLQYPESQPHSHKMQEQKTEDTLPFRIFNLTFASKKIFIQFLLASFLIIVIPVISVVLLNNYVKDDPEISNLNKVVIAIGPALVFINVVIGVYIYGAIKDPENYKVDPPIKVGKMKRN